jgi:hypothetical protein
MSRAQIEFLQIPISARAMLGIRSGRQSPKDLHLHARLKQYDQAGCGFNNLET